MFSAVHWRLRDRAHIQISHPEQAIAIPYTRASSGRSRFIWPQTRAPFVSLICAVVAAEREKKLGSRRAELGVPLRRVRDKSGEVGVDEGERRV